MTRQRHPLRSLARAVTAPRGSAVTGGVTADGEAAEAAAVVVGPHAVEVGPRRLRVGDGWCATLAVVGYPAQVGPGWLDPLLAYPGRVQVAVHVEPMPAVVAADRLRRQTARLEAERRARSDRGALADPAVDVEAARVRDLAATLLLDAVPATFRTLQGWATTLPVGVDALRLRRVMDTAALSAGFPFTSPDLPTRDARAGAGVVWGVNPASGGVLVWDRWAADNHNAVILARSGAGKSYLAKLDLLRQLYTGVEAAVIDPEDEYGRLAQAVGGAVVRLGASGVTVNPFDLDRAAPDPLTARALFAHTLVGVLLGEQVDPAGRAALDRAVIAAYAAAGITTDPRTHARPAPLLRDVTAALEADADPAGPGLARLLHPWAAGSWSGLFSGPTAVRPGGHLSVYSLRDLPDELAPAGTLLALDAVWRTVTGGQRRRRLVVVDEAWTLMSSPHGARFLHRMAKSSRKHWAGLTVVSQDAADLLGTDLGRAVVTNAATQVLLRQAPQVIHAVTDAFDLSGGERAYLPSAGRGEGLLSAGAGVRAPFTSLASPTEHTLVTTDPAELAAAEKASGRAAA